MGVEPAGEPAALSSKTRKSNSPFVKIFQYGKVIDVTERSIEEISEWITRQVL